MLVFNEIHTVLNVEVINGSMRNAQESLTFICNYTQRECWTIFMHMHARFFLSLRCVNTIVLKFKVLFDFI